MITQYFRPLRVQAKIARRLLAAVTISVFALAPIGASAAAANTSLKPTPDVPSSAHNTIAAPDPNKKVHASALATPALAWSVGLSASSTNLWPTQYTTLTATANQNVGPTPYYISILDSSTGHYVAICGTGTTCSASVTQPTATTHYYLAYVSYYPTTVPPAGVQATSAYVGVTWKSVSISLAASPTTQWIGGSVTLTSTTSADIGPSPFYAEIYDATTGVRLSACGFTTTCTATTSQSVATTHRFVAYVSNYSTTFPPAGVQAVSNSSYVTWANTGYRVSLSVNPAITFSGTTTVTATSNINVGPTPYYIEIYNLNTGTRVAICGSGTTCSASTSLQLGTNRFAAFIGSNSTAIPPLNTQASSNIATSTYYRIFTPL